MINYSLVKRGVNANLLDINFAKSRIKASYTAELTANTPKAAGDDQV